MPWITRRAIGADRAARANGRAVVRTEAIMARRAKASERTKPECGIVTAVWRDVICDRCRRLDATFQTKRAQWLDHKLVPASPSPFASAIPLMNGLRVWHLSSPI